MKTAKLIICLLASGMLAACGEDALDNSLDFSSPYVIQDDSNDPIQHHCYEIYQKYKVSVYFNDTIQTVSNGTDHKGNPIYKYETLDLNWDFSSHDGRTIKYTYDYLTTTEQKEKAMRFVDSYLGMASKPLRPFTILLTDTIRRADTNGESVSTVYKSSFRLLAMARLTNYSDEQIDSLSSSIINNSVSEKIKLNTTLTARFWEVSGKKNWYNQEWTASDGLNITSCAYLTTRNANFCPNHFWEEGAYELSKKGVRPGTVYWNWSEEQFTAARAEVTNVIGQYGFICGQADITQGDLTSPYGHVKSPTRDDDLKFYIKCILGMSETEFKTRYGGSTLVMKKYNMLVDYITNTLKIELKK